jgi:NitT/TauT family transport system permease protein
VFWRCLEIFSSGAMSDVLATILRMLAGLAGAFVAPRFFV